MATSNQPNNLYSTKVLATSEFAVNASIAVDLEKPLKKILSISCTADVTSQEKVDADFSMLGKTQINVIYQSESGKVESLSSVADWQNTLKAAGEELIAKVSVVETQVEKESAGEIVINVLHNAIVSGNISTNLAVLPTLEDHYVTDTKPITIKQQVSSGADKFVVADNTEITLSSAEIISCDASAAVKSAVAGIDQVTVEGIVDIKILYSTENGTNTINKRADFRQEIASLHALPGSEASAIVNISSITATAEIGEKTNFVVAVGLSSTVATYAETQFDVVTDAFSLTKNIDITTECVECEAYAGSKYYSDTIPCVVQLEATGVDEVVCAAAPKISIARSVVENGQLVIEGVLTSNLIYKDNQAETINAANINCPFISKTECQYSGSVQNLVASPLITSVKVRSGKEAEIVFDLSVQATIISDNYFEYVTSITETGDREINSNAISIYVTKSGESLFEVARALGVSPEAISEQNTIEGNTFEAGQRIFVYNPLNVEF